MTRLSPLFVPCRWCAAEHGIACSIIADADLASELLDEELHGGKRT